MTQWRIKAMDTARGYATIMMILGHYTEWYLKSTITPSILHFIFVSILGISAQNLFVTLPAMGVVLQQYIYKQRKMDENLLKKTIIKRGLLLILVQFICNTFLSYPGYSWTWFILSFIGLSIIIAYFISKCSHLIRIIIVIIIIILSPFLKYFFFSVFSSIYFHSNTWSIEIFIYKMFLQVVFPIFPSIVYPIIGTIYAEKIIEAKNTNSELDFIKNSLIIGIILIFAYFLLSNFYSIINFPNFLLNLPSRLDVLYVFGTNLVILSTFYWIQDWKGNSWRIFKPLRIFGLISLTVFITHFYLFPKLFEGLYFARKNTNFYSILQISTILIIIYYIYGLFVLRAQRKYSIEWLLRMII